MATQAERPARLSDLTTEQWLVGGAVVHRWLAAPNRPLSPRDQIRCADVFATLSSAALQNGNRIDAVDQAIRELGWARWQQAVDHIILLGRTEAQVGPGQQTRTSSLAKFAQKVVDKEVDSPAAYLRTCIENAAIEALRSESQTTVKDGEKSHVVRRITATLPSADGTAGEERFVWDDGEAPFDAIDGFSASLPQLPLRPTVLPTRVLQVLRGCCDLSAVMFRLGESGQGPLVDPVDRRETAARVRTWERLGHYLGEHLALGMARPRWSVDDVAGADNHVRSWQARFYRHENFVGFFDETEIPAKKTAHRARFDQHGTRFRAGWRSANALAGEVTSAYGLQQVAGVRVPFSLDPPTHPTLDVSRKQAT